MDNLHKYFKYFEIKEMNSNSTCFLVFFCSVHNVKRFYPAIPICITTYNNHRLKCRIKIMLSII